MAEPIVFDRSLYLPEAVEAAAEAYGDYATIAVATTADAVAVTISAVAEHDPQELANAFCNHVLHETIARRRQAAVQEVG
jgi:hypothetical protein